EGERGLVLAAEGVEAGEAAEREGAERRRVVVGEEGERALEVRAGVGAALEAAEVLADVDEDAAAIEVAAEGVAELEEAEVDLEGGLGAAGGPVELGEEGEGGDRLARAAGIGAFEDPPRPLGPLDRAGEIARRRVGPREGEVDAGGDRVIVAVEAAEG